MGVDPNSACFDLCCYMCAALNIFGPYRRAEFKAGIVCSPHSIIDVPIFEYRQNWSKLLVGDKTYTIVEISGDGWRDEISWLVEALPSWNEVCP